MFGLMGVARMAGQRGVEASFDPASLFASGESGYTFSVSPSTTFTDTAGTAPAAANDLVAALRTDAGTVTILTQTTSGSRLKLRGTPINDDLLGLDGDFFTPANWTLGAGWSISGGVLLASAASSAATFALAATPGKTYLVQYSGQGSGGTVTSTFGGVTSAASSSAFAYYGFLTAGSSGTLSITGAAFTGNVRRIRIYEADAADVAAPYFLTGEGGQWLEAAVTGFSAYPAAAAGLMMSNKTSGALVSVHVGVYSDIYKTLNSDFADDRNNAGRGQCTFTRAESARVTLFGDFGSTQVVGGREYSSSTPVAVSHAFGSMTKTYIGQTSPFLNYLNGRIYAGLIINRSITDAEKQNLRVFYGSDDSVQCWGDSLTAGSGGYGKYPARLQDLILRVTYNNGVGGETSAQIKTRFLANPAELMALTQVLWMGTNDNPLVNTWAPTKANIAECVAAAGSRYLVLGIFGTGMLDEINADLAATYGARFVELRAYLQSYNDGSVDDLADVAAGLIPRSLRADQIHLNDRGYELVAMAVADKLQSLGWV